MTKKGMLLSLVKPCAFFVAITGFLTSCGGGSQQQGAMPTQVETFTVARDSMTLYESYPATIKGKTDIEIRPQVTGFITKVHVDEGQERPAGCGFVWPQFCGIHFAGWNSSKDRRTDQLSL